MSSGSCTWEKTEGRYVCRAQACDHWRETGCELGKVSLTCDRDECRWHTSDGHCSCMDVHLDADGKCLGYQP